MSVGPSRAGDQFHYHWAARRCLKLLPESADLVAVAIEGASPDEGARDAGEDLIDVAEYYGSEDARRAHLIRTVQLKHSTRKTDEHWTPSGLRDTLKGFADRFRVLRQHPRADGSPPLRLLFQFITNRPIRVDIPETLEDAAHARPPRHKKTFDYLKKASGLDRTAFTEFCGALEIIGGEAGLHEQRSILVRDVSGYLPDADHGAALELKELVTRRAAEAGKGNPPITRIDVLHALKVDPDRLYPAPCAITEPEGVIPREQETEIAAGIVEAQSRPVVVHADGGVGKSVVATRIRHGMPERSHTVLYDCFGNGDYRQPIRARHVHSVALVQIANELAGAGLCHPLIPTPHADTRAYIRAFLHRLKQAITLVRQREPHALLCIVIDAADNAQMEAQDRGEGRSFVLDLLRQPMPEGVRLVVLCRSHRRDMLDLPPEHEDISLRPFNREETQRHLLERFPEATVHDVAEFHRLTSQNPRVQALAMDQARQDGLSLDAMLRGLGPNPTTVQSAINALLDRTLARMRDEVLGADRAQLDRICVGLAVLRPYIPISVLAAMSGVPEAALRSFATDLGRGLQVTGTSVQFIDEPTETWFRERFRPDASVVASFVNTLKPLAAGQPYVAAVLPRLMIEAGRFDDLVTMALSSQGLPAAPIERRDVDMQRLQFALKAAVRAERFADAAKLAFKAAVTSAAGDRQARMLRNNTDIAAAFRTPESIQEIVFRRMLANNEPGTHYAYEAALLSHVEDLKGDARSRYRLANDEIRSWLQQRSEEHRFETRITDELLAELAMVRINISGASSAAEFLRCWSPREVALRVGLLLSRRLMDHGRYDDLNELALAAGNDMRLVLAVTAALRSTHRVPPRMAVARAFRLLLDRRVKVEARDTDLDHNVLFGVVALVEAACKLNIGSPSQRADLLTRYLPATPLPSLASRWVSNGRSTMMRAYALRSALLGKPLDLVDLAHPDLRKQMADDRPHQSSRDLEDFKDTVGRLLPWHRLYAEALLGRVAPGDFPALMEAAQTAASRIGQSIYRERSVTLDEVAVLRLSLLIEVGATDTGAMAAHTAWVMGQKQPIGMPTLIEMAWLAARTSGLEACALDWTTVVRERIKAARDGAETISSLHIDICRAILPLSRRGAEECFADAVTLAGKIGDEHIARWESLLDLADRAPQPTCPNSELAYRLARGAELTYGYVVRDKYFDWEGTARAIAGLCPASGFAILARWRDRSFGDQYELLPEVVAHLTSRGDLDPRVGLAVVPFGGLWDKPELLGRALSACGNDTERRTAAEFLYRYMCLDGASASTWKRIKELAESHGILLPDIDARIELATVSEGRRNRQDGERPWQALADKIQEEPWDGIFEGLDLLSPDGLGEAKDRLVALDLRIDRGKFIPEAIRRVKVGAEPEFIAALAKIPDTDLWDLRNLLEAFPANWAGRPGVRSALSDAVGTICRRFCLSFALPRGYEPWPVGKGCALAGLEEENLVYMVVTAIGQSPDVLGTGRLFSLVGLLARLLTATEAAAVLSYGLSLFDGELQDKDGDGPWTAGLAPPGDMDMAVAGYVWSALAAPDSQFRWQAAHVVRALGRLGRGSVLNHLIALYPGGRGGPFADADLHFYAYHARQWLMIGLARMAMESPTMLVDHWGFLVRVALDGPPHAIIRRLAIQCALALLDRRLAPEDPELRARLEGLLRPMPAASGDEGVIIFDKAAERDNNDAEATGFSFQMDVGPSWLAPLGRIFGLSEAKISVLTREAIRNDLNYKGRGWWDEDRRGTRNIYPDGARYSRGSYPRIDDLKFYHSYHGMMLAAGKLLAGTPARQPDPGLIESWEYWLSNHSPSFPDGSWLFDQRDPPPLERSTWENQDAPNDLNDWRCSVQAADFEDALFTTEGRVNLYGRWTSVDGSRKETVHVSSALVGPDRSAALLRALQTTMNSHDYRLPDAHDDAEVQKAGFRLKGWVQDHNLESGQGSKDPWAGGISYPPPMPARHILRLLSLRADPEMRVWRKADGMPVLWSLLWGEEVDADGLRTVESGRRLQAALPFLHFMLDRLGMDMIVEVEIDRNTVRSRYEDASNDPFEHQGHYTRLFLIKPDGRILAS